MLNEVKLLLGFDDDTKDDLLNQIIATVETRLKIKLGGLDIIPDELSYIVTEVSVIRYNRISSEGTESHSIDGTSSTYIEDDFAQFESEITEWMRLNGKAGRLRFI